MPHAPNSEKQNSLSQQQTSLIDIVLPAGGRISGSFAEAAGTEFKALTMWQGSTLLSKTILSLRRSGVANRIVVVGPDEVMAEAADLGAECIKEGNSGPDNLFLGLQKILEEQTAASGKVLICASDLPMLSSDSILWFVRNSPADADITVPVITASSYESAYPKSGSVYVPLKDGAATMGCLFLIQPAAIMNQRQKIDEAFSSRKSQWNTFRMLGPMFLLKYITRQLTISDIEQRCEAILGWRGRAVRNAPPDLACDIDSCEDYLYTQKIFSTNEGTSE